MADKMSTIVMMVDLDCDRCYKKIRKVLCKLQDRANIKTISYDEKNKTVTVAGPFDAEEVSDRLCSGAGKVITDIHVVTGNARPGAKVHNKPGKFDGGGKPEKKHVKFDFDDGDDAIDRHAHHDRKPRVVTTTATATAASRLEAPRHAPSMSMSAMAPTPMHMPMPMPTPSMMPVQATATPSIWAAAAPEWGYSGAPAYEGWGPPAGGYYGGPVQGHGGYGPPPPYGYSRNTYQPPYYDEEPSAACSII